MLAIRTIYYAYSTPIVWAVAASLLQSGDCYKLIHSQTGSYTEGAPLSPGQADAVNCAIDRLADLEAACGLEVDSPPVGPTPGGPPTGCGTATTMSGCLADLMANGDICQDVAGGAFGATASNPWTGNGGGGRRPGTLASTSTRATFPTFRPAACQGRVAAPRLA